MASTADMNLKAIQPPVGIKLDHCNQNADALDLKVKGGSSAAFLNMQVFEERDGKDCLVYQVKGKFLTLSKKVTIRDSQGKELYVLKQRKVGLPYRFWAVDREDSADAGDNQTASKQSLEPQKEKGKDQETQEEEEPQKIVYTANAKGGLKKSLMDLEAVIFPGSDNGSQKTFKLRTGPLKTVSEITDSDGNVIAHIYRTTSNIEKIWNPCENYRLRIAPGVDATLILLISISLHVQLVNYKIGVLI